MIGQVTIVKRLWGKYVGEVYRWDGNVQGKFYYTDGSVYVGEFKDDKRNGQGTHTYTDGSLYKGIFKGEWKNGRRWNGTQYDKNRNITGKWVNGVKQK